MGIFEDLKWRGLLSDYSGKGEGGERGEKESESEFPGVLEERSVTLYVGFDPTADSLHVGHLVPLIALHRFQEAGHRPIAVAGGATGSIGDPSGKSAERNLLTLEKIRANVEAIKPQLSRLLDFERPGNPALLVDNAEWFEGMSCLDYLRDIGKFFSVNQMVARESVKARMESDSGISYTEFSYALLQSYDFVHLAREYDCELQVGGSDQWGNIVAGTDLIRRMLRRPAWGLTLPLITKSDGSKFGKTESGAVWLDPGKTSVYQFYQFWINSDDRDISRYLRFFTLLSREEIEELERMHDENPGQRAAHRALAHEMTRMIHGADACRAAEQASSILFGGSVGDVNEATIAMLRTEIPGVEVSEAELAEGVSLMDAMVSAELVPSKGQARKDIQGGGVRINGERCAEIDRKITKSDLLAGGGVLLRKGKRNYALVSMV